MPATRQSIKRRTMSKIPWQVHEEYEDREVRTYYTSRNAAIREARRQAVLWCTDDEEDLRQLRKFFDEEFDWKNGRFANADMAIWACPMDVIHARPQTSRPTKAHCALVNVSITDL